MRIYAVSDTSENGGGGKKSSTKASGRKPEKPKPTSIDDLYPDIPF